MKVQKFYIIPLLIVLNSFFVNSTSMFELSLQALITGADKIVQVKVTDVISQWDKDSSVIFTYVRMNIVDDLIGADENNEITIIQPGGIVGNTSLHVEGVSQYNVGEEDVLFLFQDKRNKETFQTLGMYQGKYKIFMDNNNVKRVKQDNSASVEQYKKKGRGYVETGNNKTLDDFKNSILQYVDKNKAH